VDIGVDRDFPVLPNGNDSSSVDVARPNAVGDNRRRCRSGSRCRLAGGHCFPLGPLVNGP
jgi:hypothetical protein